MRVFERKKKDIRPREVISNTKDEDIGGLHGPRRARASEADYLTLSHPHLHSLHGHGYDVPFWPVVVICC